MFLVLAALAAPLAPFEVYGSGGAVAGTTELGWMGHTELGFVIRVGDSPHGFSVSYSQGTAYHEKHQWFGTPRVAYVLTTTRKGWGARGDIGASLGVPLVLQLVAADDGYDFLPYALDSLRLRGQLRYDFDEFGVGAGLSVSPRARHAPEIYNLFQLFVEANLRFQ